MSGFDDLGLGELGSERKYFNSSDGSGDGIIGLGIGLMTDDPYEAAKKRIRFGVGTKSDHDLLKANPPKGSAQPPIQTNPVVPRTPAASVPQTPAYIPPVAETTPIAQPNVYGQNMPQIGAAPDLANTQPTQPLAFEIFPKRKTWPTN